MRRSRPSGCADHALLTRRSSLSWTTRSSSMRRTSRARSCRDSAPPSTTSACAPRSSPGSTNCALARADRRRRRHRSARLERDLHDGAQQRLLAPRTTCSRAGGREGRLRRGYRGRLDDAARQARAGARQLATSPAASIRRPDPGGAPAACASLADEAPLPVQVEAGFPIPSRRRWSTTAYMAVAASVAAEVSRRATQLRSVSCSEERRVVSPVEHDGSVGSPTAPAARGPGRGPRQAAVEVGTTACGRRSRARRRRGLTLADPRGHRPPARGTPAWTWLARPRTPKKCVELVRANAADVAVVDIRMPPTHTDEGLVAAARQIGTE